MVCDLPLFDLLPMPAAPAKGHAFAAGSTTLSGVDLMGGRVVIRSEHDIPSWKKVLLTPENQDVWQGDRFGTALTERIDPTHLYMQVDLGLMFGAVHIRKQIISHTGNGTKGEGYRSCWQVVPPTGFEPLYAKWENGAPWEDHTYGCWDLVPLPDGGTLVSYQWWTEGFGLPMAAQSWALEHTLPELMRAFDAQVEKEKEAGG